MDSTVSWKKINNPNLNPPMQKKKKKFIFNIFLNFPSNYEF